MIKTDSSTTLQAEHASPIDMHSRSQQSIEKFGSPSMRENDLSYNPSNDVFPIDETSSHLNFIPPSIQYAPSTTSVDSIASQQSTLLYRFDS